VRTSPDSLLSSTGIPSPLTMTDLSWMQLRPPYKEPLMTFSACLVHSPTPPLLHCLLHPGNFSLNVLALLGTHLKLLGLWPPTPPSSVFLEYGAGGLTNLVVSLSLPFSLPTWVAASHEYKQVRLTLFFPPHPPYFHMRTKTFFS